MAYILEPEVAGGLGPSSVLDTTTHPPIVSKLEYQFEGWLGDDLLETFPCFIVTERLQAALEHAHLTGASFAEVTITTSDTFTELYPGRILPRFAWLKPQGQPHQDDFGVAQDHRLVVSSRALSVLQQFNIEHCDIEAFDE